MNRQKMAQPPTRSGRELLLETIQKEPKSTGGGPMTSETVLNAVTRSPQTSVGKAAGMSL